MCASPLLIHPGHLRHSSSTDNDSFLFPPFLVSFFPLSFILSCLFLFFLILLFSVSFDFIFSIIFFFSWWRFSLSLSPLFLSSCFLFFVFPCPHLLRFCSSLLFYSIILFFYLSSSSIPFHPLFTSLSSSDQLPTFTCFRSTAVSLLTSCLVTSHLFISLDFHFHSFVGLYFSIASFLIYL